MDFQILGVALRIKIHYLDPAVDRSIKIVQQLEEVFEPYRVILRGRRRKSSSHYNVYSHTNKALKY